MLASALFTLGALAPAAVAVGSLPVAAVAEPPRLTVVVVVDQMRPDYLTRLYDRYLPAKAKDGSPGGFRWLLDGGAFFPQAAHDTLNALTGPGHATVMTGAAPARHGVVLNRWWDREKRRTAYCVADDRYPGVGSTPVRASRAGSPAHLLGTTVGDEVKLAGHDARVVSLSIKDRAAILLGGHSADLAVWFDVDGFQWATTTFYAPSGELPEWVRDVNRRLVTPPSLHVLAETAGVDMTIDLAIAAVDALALGSKRRDMLLVSLTPLDYLGHEKGPGHPDLDRLLLDHDRALARLFSHLDRAVPGGLAEVLVALTADHGAPPADATLAGLRVPFGRVDEAELLRGVEAKLKETVGPPPRGHRHVLHLEDFHLWLDPEALPGVRFEKAMDEAARFFASRPEFDGAVTRRDVEAGRLPAGPAGDAVRASWRAGRSGDVVALPKAYRSATGDVVIHMTHHVYDRMVPLLLRGRFVRPGVHATPAKVVDLAPTLAFLLGVVPPALSEGRILHEAF